jgi:hypothetical protein
MDFSVKRCFGNNGCAVLGHICVMLNMYETDGMIGITWSRVHT